jgi:hypothetical protein
MLAISTHGTACQKRKTKKHSKTASTTGVMRPSELQKKKIHDTVTQKKRVAQQT